MLVAAVAAITKVVDKISGNSAETAKNTGRSVRETQFRTQNNVIHSDVMLAPSGRAGS